MASKNYFDLLSVEVVEQILLQIIRPSDFLSLALTERRMCTIIIPAFLEYSLLKFRFNRCDVWEHLNGRPVACSRVKHIKLWCQRHWHTPMEGIFYFWHKQLITTVPRSVRTGNLEGESLPRSGRKATINNICGALSKMSNLKQVVFNNFPDTLVHVTRPRELSALALAVYNSGCKLENIDLYLYFSTKWTALEPKLSLVKMLSDAGWLSSIKTCRLSLLSEQSDLGPKFDSVLIKTLFLMVNLTHLHLTTSKRGPLWHGDMVHLWPKLEFFYVHDLEPSHPTVVQQFDPEFIVRHPRLHTLYLGNPTFAWVPTLSDSQNISPSLKSFGYMSNINAVQPVPAKNLPLSIFKNLSHLTFSPTEPNDLKIFDELNSLESCIIDVFHPFNPPSLYNHPLLKIEAEEVAASISHGCKNLRKLYFKFSLPNFAIPLNDTILSLFQDLPNLTHLFGPVASRSKQFPNSETDALMKRFYEFPKLHYIDCFVDEKEPVPTFVELRRNDSLEQMSYEILPHESTPKSCDHLEWGGFGVTSTV